MTASRAGVSPGNVRSAARTVLGDFTGALGRNRRIEDFTLSVVRQGAFSAALNGLRNNAALELRTAGGQRLARSNRRGRSPEFIQRTLAPGNYVIRVRRVSGNTRYRLQISEIPTSNPITTPNPLFTPSFPSFQAPSFSNPRLFTNPGLFTPNLGIPNLGIPNLGIPNLGINSPAGQALGLISGIIRNGGQNFGLGAIANQGTVLTGGLQALPQPINGRPAFF
jgi:hypothetical protein